jgi:hypothetical protein
MDTTHGHNWRLTAIDSTTTYRGGISPTFVATWTAALTAGRTALLTGDLDTLAVIIDDQLEAFYDPGRVDPRALDPATVTADLVEIHQSITAAALADELAAG